MLYIMRHGKTEWNALHKLQGRTDIPLNDEGRLMARQACRKNIKRWDLDVCYCSPLVRAAETAQIVLENRDIPIIKDERLMEMGFGSYEGLENSLNIPDCPINIIFQQPEKYTESVGGAETFAQLFKRMFVFKGDNRTAVTEGKISLLWDMAQ